MRISLRISLIPIFLLVIFLVGCGGSESKDTSSLEVGKVVETTSSAKAILLATNQANYKELTKFMVADDKVGVEKMFGNGKLFLIQTGTEVKILQITSNGIEVRVQEGEHSNRAGWIPSEFLKR